MPTDTRIPQTTKWREPDYESAASISYWRGQMARLLCVEPTYLDAWDIEQFMRHVSAERRRLVLPPEGAAHAR